MNSNIDGTCIIIWSLFALDLVAIYPVGLAIGKNVMILLAGVAVLLFIIGLILSSINKAFKEQSKVLKEIKDTIKEENK